MIAWHGVPPTHLTLPGLEALGVSHGFTTRHHASPAWVSAPGGPFGASVRWPLLDALGLDPPRLSFVRQVHGAECVAVDAHPPGLAGTGDALVTGTSGRALVVLTADCLPVIVVDPERRVLALAHAGWRGIVRGLLGDLPAVLAARHGARPGSLQAAIGPSIGPCCYEVDEPVVGPLAAAFPGDWRRWVRPARPGHWWLDLWSAGRDQLIRAGVPPEGIANPRLCTGCRRELFFSHRREGGQGRLATVAVLA